MLPSWFAEYALKLDVIALIPCIAQAGYGWTVASSGRFALLLKDASKGRRPTAVFAATSAVTGIVFVGLGAEATDAHLRLTESALASILLLFALVAAASWSVARIWTNKFWGLPEAESLRDEQVRTLGRVQVFLFSGFALALIGSALGLVPKLVYIGDSANRSILVLTEVVLIVIGAVLVLKGWTVFRSVRVSRSNTAPVRI